RSKLVAVCARAYNPMRNNGNQAGACEAAASLRVSWVLSRAYKAGSKDGPQVGDAPSQKKGEAHETCALSGAHCLFRFLTPMLGRRGISGRMCFGRTPFLGISRGRNL